MAKKKTDGASPGKIKIIEAGQIESIDWTKPEQYDWFDTPQEVREKAIAYFLDWSWEHYRRALWDEYKKSISQNAYAAGTVGINEQLFSLYKNGRRFPTQENADILAMYYGPIVWDICGYNRRMPRNKILHEFADDWMKLTDRAQAELLERLRNFLDNNDKREDADDVIPRDVYY